LRPKGRPAVGGRTPASPESLPGPANGSHLSIQIIHVVKRQGPFANHRSLVSRIHISPWWLIRMCCTTRPLVCGTCLRSQSIFFETVFRVSIVKVPSNWPFGGVLTARSCTLHPLCLLHGRKRPAPENQILHPSPRHYFVPQSVFRQGPHNPTPCSIHPPKKKCKSLNASTFAAGRPALETARPNVRRVRSESSRVIFFQPRDS